MNDGPNCIVGDPEMIECVCKVADRVAANCSATNGQVIDAILVLLKAFVDAFGRNDALLPRVADEITLIGVKNVAETTKG